MFWGFGLDGRLGTDGELATARWAAADDRRARRDLADHFIGEDPEVILTTEAAAGSVPGVAHAHAHRPDPAG